MLATSRPSIVYSKLLLLAHFDLLKIKTFKTEKYFDIKSGLLCFTFDYNVFARDAIALTSTTLTSSL